MKATESASDEDIPFSSYARGVRRSMFPPSSAGKSGGFLRDLETNADPAGATGRRFSRTAVPPWNSLRSCMALRFHPRPDQILYCYFWAGFREPEMVKSNRPELFLRTLSIVLSLIGFELWQVGWWEICRLQSCGQRYCDQCVRYLCRLASISPKTEGMTLCRHYEVRSTSTAIGEDFSMPRISFVVLLMAAQAPFSTSSWAEG